MTLDEAVAKFGKAKELVDVSLKELSEPISVVLSGETQSFVMIPYNSAIPIKQTFRERNVNVPHPSGGQDTLPADVVKGIYLRNGDLLVKGGSSNDPIPFTPEALSDAYKIFGLELDPEEAVRTATQQLQTIYEQLIK